MTKQEFAVFIATINTAYPKCDLITPDQTTLWFEMLGHIDFEAAKVVLKKYILNNKFPPTIADLNILAADVTNERLPDTDEAWGEVHKAIRRFGYMEERKALDSMSEATRKTVERIGFQDICKSPYDQLNTLRAQFNRAYEAECRRTMEVRKLPESARIAQERIRQLIEAKGDNIGRIESN